MITGYTQPLYFLPFDHRGSYISGLFKWKEPLNVEQMVSVARSKHVIYAAFERAVADEVVPKNHLGILVDEEFGVDILRDAVNKGYITATSVEKSGQEEFEFAYGDDFAQHIEAMQPTFAKVLVRYNPDGPAEVNARQIDRLKKLSDYLHRTDDRLFLFELLVPATPAQLEEVDGDRYAYDVRLRPGLMMECMSVLQEAGVEPDVWKLEGLDRREDCVKIVQVARRDGRDTVGLIVLGRGAERNRVVHWLRTAATVPGFIGFAVGRTTFWEPVVDVENGRISRQEAAVEIANNFEEWIRLFHEAQSAMNVAA
jgi:myo-inositol catabolism protein IolC